MRVDRQLADFRADPAAARRAGRTMAAALERWRSSPSIMVLAAELARFCDTGVPSDHAALHRLMSEHAVATETLDPLLALTAHALRADPFATLPLRHALGVGEGELRLLRRGQATLTLLLDRPGRRARPDTAGFTDSERYDLILAGEARGWVVERRDGAPPNRRPAHFLPGHRVALDRSRMRSLAQVDTALVTLRLARRAIAPCAAEMVRLRDGAVIAHADGSVAESRRECAILLLGAMGRRDAAPELATLATGCSASGPRWQALRHALALDSTIGLGALRTLAGRGDDPLAGPARDLLARLRAVHPTLQESDASPA